MTNQHQHMKLFVLVIHDTDWVGGGPEGDSQCVEKERCGGVFSNEDFAERAGRGYDHDVIETNLDERIL